MTTTQTAARFALDEDAAREWIGHAIAAYEGTEGEALPEAHLPDLGEDYRPQEHLEQGAATFHLVACARDAGIITGPGTVDYEHENDGYGEIGYTWLLRVGPLKLASLYEDIRHCGDRELRGAGAALAVLREAVRAGNGLLDDLDRYVASREG